jgi:ABC-2 type transport system permease protein
VFEPGFGDRLGGAEPAHLLLAVDASDPNTGTTMQNFARAVIGGYEADVAAQRGAVRIVTDVRMRFNPTLESVNLFVPGLIALVLTLVSALMTAISLSREKERGTLEVLLVSPLRPWQIIIGKVLPYLGLAFANVVTALLAAWLVFAVPFRGSLVLLLAECVLYAVVSLALGVLIAAVTPSQRAAMLGAMLGTMLPSTLLSGMIFPIASMPAWLSPFTNIVPARWFIVVARGIMLKGVGLEYLWRETLVLAVMALVITAAAVRTFKPRLA